MIDWPVALATAKVTGSISVFWNASVIVAGSPVAAPFSEAGAEIGCTGVCA